MQKVIGILDRIINYLCQFNLLILWILVLIVFGKAILVHFGIASLKIEDFASYLFAFVILCAISYALQKDKHVRIDMLFNTFSAKNKNLIWLFGNLLIVIPFSLTIFFHAFGFVGASFGYMESSPNGKIPYYFIFKGFILLGFMLVMIQSISEVLKSILKLKRRA